MNISFENKVALVTGAASGLGLATAKAFAESGASVVLADWNEKAVQAASLLSGDLMPPTTMPAFKMSSPKRPTLPAMTMTELWGSTCAVFGAA
jgi:enoyl-[acyl-carrier-protein] reductase (NADH)